ncbi:hypothetical protein MC885_010312 [Smutsia gigantea]|nr:hypothetical protein MC885_010312 [Smutsia gigantea]
MGGAGGERGGEGRVLRAQVPPGAPPARSAAAVVRAARRRGRACSLSSSFPASRCRQRSSPAVAGTPVIARHEHDQSVQDFSGVTALTTIKITSMPPKKGGDGIKAPPIIGRFGTSLKIGIVGLPNVGKSTFFNVLTNSQASAENFPFCTIDPNESRVPVPDERFEFLCQYHKPAR